MQSINVDETLGPDRYATSAEATTTHAGNTDDGGQLAGPCHHLDWRRAGQPVHLVGRLWGGRSRQHHRGAGLRRLLGGLATNLSSTAGGVIQLYLQDGSSLARSVLVGRDADGGSDVFRIEIVNTAASGDPAVYQLQTTLYQAIRHTDTTKHDESAMLKLASAGRFVRLRV